MPGHQFSIRTLLIGVAAFAVLLSASVQFADNRYVIYSVVGIVVVAFMAWIFYYEGPDE